MSVSERLKTIRDLLGKTQKEMALLTGISYRTWQNYEDGVNPPGWDACEALVKLGFNANWLLTGNGGMRDGTSYAPPELAKRLAKVLEPGDGFVQVPRYEVTASAGGGTMIHSEQIVDHLSFRADWVHNALGVPVADLALINVTGDSMEPTLSEGDLILIDMSHRGVKDNAVYVLQLNGSLLVKRIQHKLDGSVIVKSDNAIYEPEQIGAEAVDLLNVIGRVVWCGRRM